MALVALLTFGCSACLAFGFLAYLLARLLLCSPFWANFALLGSLARLLPRRFVILSGAKNPYIWFYGYFATLSMTKALNFVILSGVRKHKAKNPYFKKCNLHFKFKNLRLNLNSTYSANCGKWILRYRSVWQANLAFDSLFACRKNLIANSVPNLPFVCQANSNTIKIIAQKISFAEKICKFFQAHAQNKAKKVPQITENVGWGGGFCVFVKFWKNFWRVLKFFEKFFWIFRNFFGNLFEF